MASGSPIRPDGVHQRGVDCQLGTSPQGESVSDDFQTPTIQLVEREEVEVALIPLLGWACLSPFSNQGHRIQNTNLLVLAQFHSHVHGRFHLINENSPGGCFGNRSSTTKCTFIFCHLNTHAPNLATICCFFLADANHDASVVARKEHRVRCIIPCRLSCAQASTVVSDDFTGCES